MNDQLSLLSQVPASRRSDPTSSHAAERAVTESGTRASQQHRVLNAVHRWPGSTSKELAWRINRWAAKEGPALDRYAVARRLGDMNESRVFQGAQKRCPIAGRKCVTWWPTERAAKDSHNGADHAPTSNTA